MGNPSQTYAMLMNLARRYRGGERPLSEASSAVRKEVVSGMPEDPSERPAPKPKDDDKPSS